MYEMYKPLAVAKYSTTSTSNNVDNNTGMNIDKLLARNNRNGNYYHIVVYPYNSNNNNNNDNSKSTISKSKEISRIQFIKSGRSRDMAMGMGYSSGKSYHSSHNNSRILNSKDNTNQPIKQLTTHNNSPNNPNNQQYPKA